MYMQETRAQIDSLGRVLAALNWNNFLPIHQLPNEILEEIFQISVSMKVWNSYHYIIITTPSIAWVKLTHVCHRWRRVALGCPRLWSEFSDRISKRWAEAFMTRSLPRPIDPTVYFDYEKKAVPEMVLAQSARIRNLDISGDARVVGWFINSLANPPIPQLAELTVSYPSSWWPSAVSVPAALIASAVCLRTLRLGNGVWVGDLSKIMAPGLQEVALADFRISELKEMLCNHPHVRNASFLRVRPSMTHHTTSSELANKFNSLRALIVTFPEPHTGVDFFRSLDVTSFLSLHVGIDVRTSIKDVDSSMALIAESWKARPAPILSLQVSHYINTQVSRSVLKYAGWSETGKGMADFTDSRSVEPMTHNDGIALVYYTPFRNKDISLNLCLSIGRHLDLSHVTTLTIWLENCRWSKSLTWLTVFRSFVHVEHLVFYDVRSVAFFLDATPPVDQSDGLHTSTFLFPSLKKLVVSQSRHVCDRADLISALCRLIQARQKAAIQLEELSFMPSEISHFRIDMTAHVTEVLNELGDGIKGIIWDDDEVPPHNWPVLLALKQAHWTKGQWLGGKPFVLTGQVRLMLQAMPGWRT